MARHGWAGQGKVWYGAAGQSKVLKISLVSRGSNSGWLERKTK